MMGFAHNFPCKDWIAKCKEVQYFVFWFCDQKNLRMAKK